MTGPITITVPHEDALKLFSNAQVTPRVQALVGRQLLAARVDGRIRYAGDAAKGVKVYVDNELLGVARSYKTYWQIFISETKRNIRRNKWQLLQDAIRHYVEDREHAKTG